MKARKVMARKVTVICVSAGILAMLATGCQDSMQTEEEIVVPRQEQGADGAGSPDGQSAGGENGGEGKDTENGRAGGSAAMSGIAGQVQAPDEYAWEGGNDTVSVKVDAAVEVPQAEGFQTYKVTSRVFAQADYDKVSRVLLGGAPLWERDYEKMEGSHGFTKAEVEERISILEERKAQAQKAGAKDPVMDDEKGKSYDEEIKVWEDMGEKAPEEAVFIDVPALVSYTESAEDIEDNYLSGYATVDGQDYFVSLDNNLRDDWRWVSFAVRNQKEHGGEIRGTGQEELNRAVQEAAGDPVGRAKAEEDLPVEEITKKAESLVSDMGFSDFAVDGGEYYWAVTGGGEDDLTMDYVGYQVNFARLVDGIPVTYTSRTGTTVDDGDICSWPYESLRLIFDEDVEMTDFVWENPYQLEKLSDEYVFLMPFSDIQDIFEEMVIKKYTDFVGEEQIRIALDIDRVRLGYMRVREKGNLMEGTLIPVWDFFGSETFYYEGTDETYTVDGESESWLTINAMDGTVVDRGLGY